MSILRGEALLDTSVVIRHLRADSAVTAWLEGLEFRYLPLVALGELCFGAFRSAQRDRQLRQIEEFLPGVRLLSPDAHTSMLYGRISARLALAGNSIPQNDTWIAALALQHGLPVATCDHHFERVEGLDVILH